MPAKTGGTRYRRGGLYAADMAAYSRLLAEDPDLSNEGEIAGLKEKLAMAIRQELSSKQRLYILLYYAEGLNMAQIGEQMGVDKSTVSRTIRRAEANLRRCLRFGAANLLEQTGFSAPSRTVSQLAKREGYENI